jgi:hypothetical protein
MMTITPLGALTLSPKKNSLGQHHVSEIEESGKFWLLNTGK